VELMQVDKKAAAGRIRFVLLSGIGAAELRGDVEESVVLDTIAACNAATAATAPR
jgi:3-dehydroquinate synthetase